jgi:hypothetical protein
MQWRLLSFHTIIKSVRSTADEAQHGLSIETQSFCLVIYEIYHYCVFLASSNLICNEVTHSACNVAITEAFE